VDTLVVIDDSIVRGTTLKESIIRMLARLHPKRIIVVSSSPQIRYPDCYGIDMSKMGDFIAFNAAIELHRSAALNLPQMPVRPMQGTAAQRPVAYGECSQAGVQAVLYRRDHQKNSAAHYAARNFHPGRRYFSNHRRPARGLPQ
jgi:hypothetical protein